MTYLFILIALPVINSVLMSQREWINLAVSNLIVIAVLFVLEQGWGSATKASRVVKYDRIDLLKPEKHAVLLEICVIARGCHSRALKSVASTWSRHG